VLALDPHTLRAGHAQQLAAVDGQRPPRHDVALDLAFAEGFFIVAALGVAIVELADRGVAPVDDVHARLAVGEGGPADEDVALDFAVARNPLAQAQVPEIRRARIHQHGLELRARERHLLQALHLRHQGGHVLEPCLADLIAQGEKLVVPGDAAPPAGSRRRRPQTPEHALEQPLFLLGNGSVVFWFCVRHGRVEL